ncbi:MAG: methyltransferase domain-containing protein [Actinomycetota bacterium]|nr:methyltransferase domain-containing protein [Actinomycetota bacterium]
MSQKNGLRRRSASQQVLDFVTFPMRAVMPFQVGVLSKWNLTSRSAERFDYAAREVIGYTLDLGCGPHEIFVRQYLGGNGLGIDVHPFDGLREEQIVEDPTHLPFEDSSFDSATLIATLHHIPPTKRDAELAEIHRILKPGGKLVVTQTVPLANMLVHGVTRLHAKLLGNQYDMDLLRTMDEEEEHYVTEVELTKRMRRAGFTNITRKRLATQWGLNRLFAAWKQ